METKTDVGILAGLLGYEIVLLAMGVLLFLVGIWALVRAIGKGSSFVGPLLIFPIALLFAGYPGLQGFNIKSEFGELGAQFGHGQSPALSPEQQQAAAKKIDALAPRASTPEQQAIIANAYRGIGDVDKAYTLATKIDATKAPVELSKSLAPVYEAKLKQTVQDVPVAPTPGRTVDPAKAAQIDKLVRQLDTPAASLPAQTWVTIARANAALGNDTRAAASLDKAQAIQHDVRIDPHLLERLKRPPSG
jgi:hypothetical protein